MNKGFFCFCAVILPVVLSVSMNAMQQEVTPIVERTLAIIKPDAVAAGHAESIISIIKSHDFKIVGRCDITLTRDQAEHFYGIHKGKPFFEELVSMMTRGPIVVLALEKVGAIQAWRDLMGNTDPAKAASGTIRKLFGKDKGSNATHGSDAPETAANELAFFFPKFPSPKL